jgi:spore maturation protein CgeB
MRILYVGSRWEYGDPSLGLSFEEMNFRSALEGMGNEVVAFDFAARLREAGRDAMNDELVKAAAGGDFDLVFLFMLDEEIEVSAIERIGAAGTPTLNWFADDHWRFEGFTRHYAPALSWSVTTDHESIPKYRAIGVENVVLSQWACNRYAYDRGGPPGDLRYDVTFVGQPHGDRREVVEQVRAAGFDVQAWGNGWDAGRLDHDGMVDVFRTSRINLNLSNSFVPKPSLRMRLGALARGQRIDRSPRRSQIKGRTFEVPGSGGFLLTERVPHLDEYFEIGTEIAAYSSASEVVEQVRHWLSHPDERAAVAEAGYRRVQAEHTYDRRFAEIFRRMGLSLRRAS